MILPELNPGDKCPSCTSDNPGKMIVQETGMGMYCDKVKNHSYGAYMHIHNYTPARVKLGTGSLEIKNGKVFVDGKETSTPDGIVLS